MGHYNLNVKVFVLFYLMGFLEEEEHGFFQQFVNELSLAFKQNPTVKEL